MPISGDRQKKGGGMIERFQGDAGRPRLIGALCSQQLVGNEPGLAEALAGVVELQQVAKGEVLISQESGDCDLFFILSGCFQIVANGHLVARRKHNLHVGEMSMAAPNLPRSADVVAEQPSVVAKVSQAAFTELAQQHPNLWRRIAAELADRLRQRNELLRKKNPRPVLFIGSSVGGVGIANKLQSLLCHDQIDVNVWSFGVFEASGTTIQSLEEKAQQADFAALVMTPDDVVQSKGVTHQAPRDNVVFELGLFMGAIGRPRTFMVKANNGSLKQISDLLGVTPVDYPDGPADTLTNRLNVAATTIREAVAKLGVR